MQDKMFRCACCRRYLLRDPRSRNQRYCGQRKCQQARKNKWQKQKLASDPDYRTGKRDSQRAWQQNNKGYWKKYRRSHPAYEQRNRQQQRQRDQHRLPTVAQESPWPPGDLVKKDALMVKIIPISTG